MAKKKDAGKESDVEEKPAEGEAGVAPPPKKKKKLVLILAIAVPLLLGGVGAGLFFGGVIGGKKKVDLGPPECIHKEAGKDDKAKDAKPDAKDSKDAKKDDKPAPLTEDEQKACEKAKDKIAKDAKKAEKKAAGGKGEEKKEGDKGAASDSDFFDLPDMLVNLDTGGKRQVFLKISVSLELDDPSDKAALTAVMPRIVDQFQTYLRELRVEDLRGSAGVYRLRQELLARVQPAVAPIEIKDVLFKEILVQ